MLRRALGEAMKRVNMLSSDSSAMVDRRIAVKLLVTYFERGQSAEVMALMARMLGFSGIALLPGINNLVCVHAPVCCSWVVFGGCLGVW